MKGIAEGASGSSNLLEDGGIELSFDPGVAVLEPGGAGLRSSTSFERLRAVPGVQFAVEVFGERQVQAGFRQDQQGGAACSIC